MVLRSLKINMTHKKKIVCGSLIAILVLLLIAYVAANVVLDRVSRQHIAQLVAKAEQRGIWVSRPSFKSARFSLLLSPTWSDIRADVSGHDTENGERGPEWELQVERATMDWEFDDKASLIARGVTLAESSAQPEEQNVSGRQIILDRISCQFPLDLMHPKSAIPVLMRECERLISDGATSLPLEIAGKIVFKIRDEPAKLHLKVVQWAEGSSLALNEEDVASLSSLFEERFTDAEVELISSYPLRAARLLQIKDLAEVKSVKANQRDASVPQDAYRHVLWSYLLTQAYGEEFAEQVGNAHESGDTGNTAAEREMDLHNNAIGRKYAEQDIKQNEVLQHLMSDPEVQQTPEAARE